MAGLKCGFCKQGKEVESDCGELHHVKETVKHKSCTAHHKCMQYSALLVQYKDDYFGGFKVNKVLEEQKRGRKTKCSICRLESKKAKKKIPLTGATAGCAVKKCKKSFHFFCAKNSKECVTKRLIVSFKTSHTETVLYRVFCSEDHEKSYRENIKQYMTSKKDSSSSTEGTDESDEEKDDDQEKEVEEKEEGGGEKEEEEEEEGGEEKEEEREEEGEEQEQEEGGEEGDEEEEEEEEEEEDISIEANLQSSSNKENKSKSGSKKTDASNITDSSYIDISPLPSKKPASRLKRELPFSDESERKKLKDSNVFETEKLNKNHLSNKHVSFCETPPEKELNANPTTNNTESKSLNYALCVLSTTQHMERQRREITEIITSSQRNIDRIIIWQEISSVTLTKDLAPYFILDISKEIMSTKTLNRLLFSEKYLKEKRDQDYQYKFNFIKELKDPEVMKNVLQSTWKAVSENVDKATLNVGQSAGVLVNTSEGGNVLILYLRDAIDNNYTIRSNLYAENEIFLWNDSSSVCHVSNGWFHKAEIEILTKCINSYMEEISRVFLLPEDIFLRKTQHYPSVVNHLVEKYKNVNNLAKNTSACLILLSELDSCVVNCSHYILKMLDHIIMKEISNFSHFLALLPVFDLPKSFRFQDEIPKFLKNKVDVKVFSADDPVLKEISCVVVELKISGHSNPDRKPAYVKDREKPSTSGANTNRWLRAHLSPSALVSQQNNQHKH